MESHSVTCHPSTITANATATTLLHQYHTSFQFQTFVKRELKTYLLRHIDDKTY